MRELEDICVSMETAKVLAGAGIEVDSYFCWAMVVSDNCMTEKMELMAYSDLLPYQMDLETEWIIEQYPAPTSGELIKKFPINKVFWFFIQDGKLKTDDSVDYPEKPCELLAMKLIRLKKEGLM